VQEVEPLGGGRGRVDADVCVSGWRSAGRRSSCVRNRAAPGSCSQETAGREGGVPLSSLLDWLLAEKGSEGGVEAAVE
jgi:hypothetical protein